MQRTSQPNMPIPRWDNSELTSTSCSFILKHSLPNSRLYNNSPKNKYDQYGFKSNQLVRHQSEKEFKKGDFQRGQSYMFAPEINMRSQEDEGRTANNLQDRVHQSQIYPLGRKILKTGQVPPVWLTGRNSGGKVNNALKQTSSTSSTENLITHKSQRAFPSFLRNNAKTGKSRTGLCRQNFKVIRKLGEGKFGNVFLAREMFTGLMVGLKVVQKKRIIKDNFLTQFIRQLKIQSFLDHPNIIKIYGYFQDEQNFYIVMELGCGGQLFDSISQGQTLNEESTSFVVGNLLDAVQLMHKYKILHRDIKPQNIVLVHGNIKLCDFGWAVNKKEELRSTFCGTPLYLSPEMLQGSRYDEKVDIWAVGVLAYELFYGSSPFDINQHEDLIKIVTDEIQFPPNKAISKQFKEFLTAILKKNPQERLECKQLLALEFIQKYWQLQTCEALCR